MKPLLLQLAIPVIALVWAEAGYSAPPSWATRDTQKRVGSSYEVVCSGNGPDINIARDNATNQCDISAVKQFKTSINVKSLTVETETDASMHSEVSSNVVIKNLQCNPINESVDYAQDRVTVYLKCRYNLTETSSHDGEPETSIKSKTFADGSAIKTVSIASVPPCANLIVRGNNSRTIKCESNPMSIAIYPSDNEVIIRADKYQPKTVSANDLLTKNGAYNVFLEPVQ